MHTNVPALRWEREKRREAKVSQARHHCRFLSLPDSKHPTLLAPLAALGGQTKEEEARQKSNKNQ